MSRREDTDLFHTRAAVIRRTSWFLTGLTLLCAIVVWWDGFYWRGAIGVAGLAGGAALMWVLSRKRIPLLWVGPDGFSIRHRSHLDLPWHEIRDIRLQERRWAFTGSRHVLVVEPKEGHLPPGPVWLSSAFETRRLQPVALRIPLRVVAGPPERLLTSIERYFPLTRDHATVSA